MAYEGLIAELPIGLAGLTGNKNQATVTPDHLLVADDITYESGTIRKEGGASKYNSTSLGGSVSILGGWDWFPVDGTQRSIVLLSDGTIKKDDGGGSFGTTLKSGLTTSADTVPVFVEGGKEAAANDRKLFIYTGANILQVLSADGNTTADINSTTDPADWATSNPTFGLMHDNRHWGGGNSNDPHRLYYSATADHEQFDPGASDAGTLSIYPGEGMKLVGAISFKGLIICWKFPKGIYVVDTTDPTIANWKISRLSESIGGISPLAAVLVDDDVLFMDSSGLFHFVSAITEFGNLGTRNLSTAPGMDMDEFMRREINFDHFPRTRAIYYAAKAEAHFSLAAIGSAVLDRRLVVDFNNSGQIRFRFSRRDTCISLWLRQDSEEILRPASGDDEGFVWNMDTDGRSKDGSGYEGRFQIPHLDLGHLDPPLGTKRKSGHFLELVVEPKGNWNLNVDVLWDDAIVQTVTFNMGTTGSTIGSFVLGTDRLAGDAILNKKRRITGSGRRFSLIGRNNGDSEDFSVSKFYLHFVPNDERLT